MDERDADGGRDLLHWDVVVVVVIVVVLLLLLFCQIRFRLGASFDPFFWVHKKKTNTFSQKKCAKRETLLTCESNNVAMKTSSSSTTIPGITGGERGGERGGGRRRKVSIFICLLCILFLCVVFTYHRASTFSPSQDDDVGGRVVRVGGRDDGDDDVTKNTY